MRIRGYYFITDKYLSRAGNKSDVMSAVNAGVKMIQYREKTADSKELYEEAVKLKKLCRNASFIINDRVDIALACGADGVHLGQRDMPVHVARKLLGKNMIIGVTVHNLKEAVAAQRNKADYLAVGPVFFTGTKKDAGIACGSGLISKIKEQVDLPVVAIGGINPSNIEEVFVSGADGFCAISAVVTKPDVQEQIIKLQSLWKKSA